MAASSLRRWLRRAPQPVKLRVDGRDVAIATGANQWAVTEESVLALSPSRIEAIDANGVCLRAMQFDRDEDDKDDKDDKDKGDAGKTELVLLARLLAEAHDAGARRHAEAYALAFAENTHLVQILAERLSGLESAWQKAMQETAKAQASAVLAQAQQSDNDPAGAAIGAMLTTALARGAPPAQANGAKKGDK